MKRLAPLLLLALSACGSGTETPTPSETATLPEQTETRDKSEASAIPLYEVQHYGALKNIMHKGDLSAQAHLKDFENTPHLYALGAVADLKGEILILDGHAYISSGNDGAVAIDETFEHEAALFVYATVPEWQSFDVPAEVASYKELEAHVANVAQQHGIDTDQPFPFMVEGKAASFDWHVIDWPEGDTEHSHEKHVTSGPHDTWTDREVQLLGFYSAHHHAIYTHHTTNMHLHALTSDQTLAGHVDGLTLGNGMRLMLPSTKQ